MTGTSIKASLRAASSLPWPAIVTESLPARVGFTNPNSLINAAIWATCSSEWVRALRA